MSAPEARVIRRVTLHHPGQATRDGLGEMRAIGQPRWRKLHEIGGRRYWTSPRLMDT